MKYFATADNREAKARKIEAVLCDHLGVERVQGRRILDLGCGSGHIAEYFSRGNSVVAADVVDQLRVPRGAALEFKKMNGAALPFEDGSFDIVIYNHVLFCLPDQLGQMREIKRVLKNTGACYLATANRYFPREGFTKVFLIHYLPQRVFRAVYKAIRRKDLELHPVGYHGIRALITRSGFTAREYTAEIVHHPERYHSDHAIPSFLPVPVCMSPTVVFVLSKQEYAP